METREKKTIVIELIDRFQTAAKFLCGHLGNPQSCTYYPQEERKSRLAIYLDNLRWILKYHEINHFYYLYGFDRKIDINQNDYIATGEFFELREKVNKAWIGNRKAAYFCLLQDKFLFGQYLKALGFPTPVNLAICDRETITWLDSQETEPLESLLERDKLDVFIKELLGESSRGIYPLKTEDGKLFVDDKEVTVEELKKIIPEMSVVQQRLYQHPQMCKLHPNSLNTIRIVTLFSDNEVVPMSAVMRVGVKGRQFDNWAAGGISLAIDLTTGRLSRKGICKPGLGGIVEQHPDTGIIFEGFEIPNFAQVVQMVCALHGFFYGIHSVGWDVAIAKEGPVVVEGNNLWEVSIMQAHDSNIKNKFIASLPDEIRLKIRRTV
jgi:hypothetical protein